MTTAFNFATPPNPSRPNLDHPVLAAIPKLPQCVPNVALGTDGQDVNSLSGALPPDDAYSGNRARPWNS